MPIVLNMQTLAVSLLAATALGGVAWVFIYPHLSGERHVERRRDLVARSEPIRREARTARPQRSRRDQVEESLKELEQRNKKSKKPSLSVRIAQAGLTWSKQRFFVTGGILGLLLFIMPLVFGFGLLPALAFGFAGAAGLPFWILSFLKKRREAKFLEHFPDAVDVIVRGIKSGLPLLDCMKLISIEAQEPVRTEFRIILDTQSVGLPLGEACAKLFDRIPLPEANFFGIVITIQQKAGGNLSEALGNLSRVLRDRKKMKAKIQAMSMEAKASAGIIGVLPLAVMSLIYITSPEYISLLFKEQIGHMMLAACGLWMCVGVFVMRKMIQFDF
jgi:tight adherence protein B